MTPNRSWGRKKTPKKKSGIVPAKVQSFDPAFRVQFRLEMWKVARMEADALHFCFRRVFEKVCAFPSLDEYHTSICVVCIQTGYFFINQWYCIEIDSRKGLHGCKPRHGSNIFSALAIVWKSRARKNTPDCFNCHQGHLFRPSCHLKKRLDTLNSSSPWPTYHRRSSYTPSDFVFDMISSRGIVQSLRRPSNVKLEKEIFFDANCGERRTRWRRVTCR